MAYRITVPLVAWILHLPPLAALVLPYFAHVGFLSVCFVALRRRATPGTAFLTTAIISLSFALFWSNWRPGFTDTVTHLLSVSLLLTTSPALVYAAILGGLLNDERMVLALPFVVCWNYPPSATVSWLKSASTWLSTAILSAGTYAFVRHGLTVGWIGAGIAQPEVYQKMGVNLREFRPHLGSWSVWALNVFLSFRWAWVLLLAYPCQLLRESRRTRAAFLVVFVALGALASAAVADVSRSVGFMAPALLLAVAGLKGLGTERLQSLLLWVLVALILTPVFFTFEDYHVQWFRPLPLVLWRCLTGWDLVQLLHQR